MFLCLRRYCGDGLDKVEGGSLRGAGPLIVAFISDESDTMQGFKFKYQSEFSNLEKYFFNVTR